MLKSPKVLFILKQRQPGPYGSWSYSANRDKILPSGLTVSAGEMVKALSQAGITTEAVQVIDNNCIDREVSRVKPTHVIIEAFWVVPDKFEVLKKLHPNVTWVVRNHSKIPFLSAEGGMIGWAMDYLQAGVVVASNSLDAAKDLRRLADGILPGTGANSIYLPNYYNGGEPHMSKWEILLGKVLRFFKLRILAPVKKEIKIGCFGAIRPLKNTLMQAVAAIELAEMYGLELQFFINATRVEGRAESNLNSIRALFKRYSQHLLVEVEWKEHSEFLNVINDMDIVCQVSNSETFNIVAADAVNQGVPVVVSSEIPWLDSCYHADPNSSDSILDQLERTWIYSESSSMSQDQLCQLKEYCNKALKVWLKFLTHSD